MLRSAGGSIHSEESSRICEEAGIGYADLAGNAHLSFDQFFIETHTAGESVSGTPRGEITLCSESRACLRVLLQGPLRPWKVVELADAAQVSLGWVSAVRQQLFAREWAVDEPGGLRVTKTRSIAGRLDKRR